jgi:hypothetical protein
MPKKKASKTGAQQFVDEFDRINKEMKSMESMAAYVKNDADHMKPTRPGDGGAEWDFVQKLALRLHDSDQQHEDVMRACGYLYETYGMFLAIACRLDPHEAVIGPLVEACVNHMEIQWYG